MSVMGGETVTRLLRSRGLNTPIVALTAHAMKGFGESVLAAGFTGYLTKPIDLDKLMATIAGLIGGEQCAPALKKPAFLPITAYKAGSVPRAPVVSRLAGNPRLRPAVEKFVDRPGVQLDAMESAWKTQDFQTLAELVHWLKGAGGTVGFDAIVEPAKQLEQLAKAGTGGGLNEVVGELRDLTPRIDRPGAEENNTQVPVTALVNP